MLPGQAKCDGFFTLTHTSAVVNIKRRQLCQVTTGIRTDTSCNIACGGIDTDHDREVTTDFWVSRQYRCGGQLPRNKRLGIQFEQISSARKAKLTLQTRVNSA